jgi:hypothetical protein
VSVVASGGARCVTWCRTRKLSKPSQGVYHPVDCEAVLLRRVSGRGSVVAALAATGPLT